MIDPDRLTQGATVLLVNLLVTGMVAPFTAAMTTRSASTLSTNRITSGGTLGSASPDVLMDRATPSPREGKRAAIRTVERLDTSEQRRLERAQNQTLALLRGTVDDYRDQTRMESTDVFVLDMARGTPDRENDGGDEDGVS